MRSRVTFGALWAATVVLLLGCGGGSVGPVKTEGEAGAVEDLVFSTSAQWQEKAKFDLLFAQGAVPSDKERQAFRGKFVNPEGIKIDGDTATIEVILSETIKDEPVEKTVTWEAKKEGDAWKLTKAPLQ